MSTNIRTQKHQTHKKQNKKTKNTKKHKLHTFLKITPQTIIQLFRSKNTAFVNVLSDTIHIHSPSHPLYHNFFGKSFITKTCNQLNKFDSIILYCANYTCTASQTYAEQIVSKCKNLYNKILLYEGGTYEWALLNMSFPNIFSFYNSYEKRPLTQPEIENEFVTMKHRDEINKRGNYPPTILNHQSDKFFYQTLINKKQPCIKQSSFMNGKVCVVTGGTSGLGLAVVYKLLESGAKHVTLTYFHDSQRAKKVELDLSDKFNKNRFHVLKADARTIQGNMLTFDRELRKKKLKLDVGPIDCVDVNAGVFGPANLHKKHLFNIKEKDYNKTLDTNLHGYFLSMKYFSKQAIENNVRDAAIVCIKSIYGSTGSLFSNIAYQTSKHGVMGLVHQSAIELARPNHLLKIKYPIRVNAVSPTFTDTALTRPFLDKNLINKTLNKSNTMGRLAYKNDVAEAVLFLLSNKARSITGIDLPVDCGVLVESIPTYEEVLQLNSSGIQELSCCGNTV